MPSIFFYQGLKYVTAIWVVLVLAACSAGGVKSYNPQHYTVQSGDTLYLIAWKYKLDHKRLAARNGIKPPYTVYPGQRILISAQEGGAKHWPKPKSRQLAGSSRHGNSMAKGRFYVVKSGDTLYSLSRRLGVPVATIKRLNHLNSNQIYKGQRLLVAQSRSTSHRPKARPVPRPARRPTKLPPVKSVLAPTKWVWPTQGKVISRFKGDDSTQQGIDIAGKLNQPIRAISDGVVVYQGKGLIKFGQTVIVKHNESFLSAYAYNQKALVKEGDKVRIGQQIATMGRMGQSSPLLHIEIRQNGKAVDPLIYLDPP